MNPRPNKTGKRRSGQQKTFEVYVAPYAFCFTNCRQAQNGGNTAEDASNITDPNQDTTPEGGQTFTQADVDRIVADRLSRERKNQPSAERMKAFEEWENSRKNFIPLNLLQNRSLKPDWCRDLILKTD